MPRARSVDEYIASHPQWCRALTRLRDVLARTELEETVKWGMPCYTIDGKNVLGIAAFARHVSLWFFQGVFLSDPDRVLVNAQEGRTKAQRQWRFSVDDEIRVARVRAYVLEAIANQKRGKARKPDSDRPVVVPPELAAALSKRPRVEKAFVALTRGRQREYAEYVADAKRAETKANRVAKILPMIEAGVGLNDRYRRC